MLDVPHSQPQQTHHSTNVAMRRAHASSGECQSLGRGRGTCAVSHPTRTEGSRMHSEISKCFSSSVMSHHLGRTPSDSSLCTRNDDHQPLVTPVYFSTAQSTQRQQQEHEPGTDAPPRKDQRNQATTHRRTRTVATRSPPCVRIHRPSHPDPVGTGPPALLVEPRAATAHRCLSRSWVAAWGFG